MITEISTLNLSKINKVVCYSRVASLGIEGTEETSTLRTQEFSCAEFAEQYGLTVDKFFGDAGVSGIDDDRPELNAMLEYLADHQTPSHQNIVLVKDISRIARDALHHRDFLRKLNKVGAVLITAYDAGKESA